MPEFTPRHLELALDETHRMIARIEAMGIGPETQAAYDLAARLQQELIHVGNLKNWYAYPGADRHWHVLPLQEHQPKTVLAQGESWCWHCQEGHCDEHGVGV